MHHNAELHLNNFCILMSYPCIHIEFYYDRNKNKNYVDYSTLEIQKSDQHCDTRKTDRSFTRLEK